MTTAWKPRRLALDALTVVLATVGVVLIVIGGGPPAGRPDRPAEAARTNQASEGPPGPPASGAPRAPAAATRGNTGPAPLRPSEPVGLDIPAIGVSTSLITLGLNPDGTIVVPPLRADAPAGWYRHLATPGEVGPAIILGHVDTAAAGPAVFHRLRELRPGDTVAVRRRDGSTAVFTVNRVAEYPKALFPTDAVYGPVDHPALRLVTCGGSFDAVRRQYRGNVVAYAALTATLP